MCIRCEIKEALLKHAPEGAKALQVAALGGPNDLDDQGVPKAILMLWSTDTDMGIISHISPTLDPNTVEHINHIITTLDKSVELAKVIELPFNDMRDVIEACFKLATTPATRDPNDDDDDDDLDHDAPDNDQNDSPELTSKEIVERLLRTITPQKPDQN